MKKGLLIFDIDGTLLKSETLHQAAFTKAMRAVGISDINTDWPSYRHHTDSFIFKENYVRSKKKIPDNASLEHFEEEMMRQLDHTAEVNEIKGARDFLTALAFREFAVCFATGSLRKPALYKLQKAGFSFREEVLATSNQHLSREAIVNHAIARAKRFYGQEKFGTMLSFGDGAWDLETAKNLDLSFVCVGPQAKGLLSQGADHHIRDFTGLSVDVLEKLTSRYA